jgi:hypothetical protein
MSLSVAALTRYLQTAEPRHIYELLHSVSHADEVVVASARQLVIELAARHLTPDMLVTIAQTIREAKFPAEALRFAIAAYRSDREGAQRMSVQVFEMALNVANDVGEEAVHALVREYLTSRPPSSQSLTIAQIVRRFGSTYNADALEIAAHSISPPDGSLDIITETLAMVSEIVSGTKPAQDGPTRALARRVAAHIARMLPLNMLNQMQKMELKLVPLVFAEIGIASIAVRPQQSQQQQQQYHYYRNRRESTDMDSDAQTTLDVAKWVVQQVLTDPDDSDTLSSAVSSVCAVLSEGIDAYDFAQWLRDQAGVSATLAAMATARAIKLMANTIRQIEIISWAMNKVVRDVPSRDLAGVVQALLAGVTDASISCLLGKTIDKSATEPAHRQAALECVLHALSKCPLTNEPYDIALRLSTSADGSISAAAAEHILEALSRTEDIAAF